MKKFSILLVMFMSVLISRGQTEPDFDTDNAGWYIDYFNNNLQEVIDQADEKGKVDRLESEILLNDILEDEMYIIDSYDQIKDNISLSKRAAYCINQFNTEYYNAIIWQDPNGEVVISIGSTTFFQVANKYKNRLHQIREEIETYINNRDRNNTSEDEDLKYESIPEGEKNNEDKSSVDSINGKLNAQPENNGSYLTAGLMLIILFLFGIAGLVIGIIALNKVSKANKRVQELSEILKDYREKTDSKIKELEPSNYRGKPANDRFENKKNVSRNNQTRTVNDSFNHNNQNSNQYSHTQQQQQSVHQQTSTQQSETAQSVTPQPAISQSRERPTATYLFATAKSGDVGQTEFYKVTPENNGDKVFMLTLSNITDEVAVFNIAPNMSADFLRSVLNDRETYLPTLFCDKQIISANPTRIEVDAPGHAKKVDGKWMIQDRIKIRLV